MKQNPIKQLFKTYSGLPKDIWIIFFATVVNRMGDFVVPFLALYFTKKMGMEDLEAGSLVSVVVGSGFFGVLIGGKLADHVGRKKVMLISQAITAISFILAGFFLGTSVMIPLLIVAGIFTGAVRPVFNAMVSDLAAKPIRQKSFSLRYLGINLGVAIGGIIGGQLFDKAIEWIFWGDALTTFISIFLIAYFVREANPETTEVDHNHVDEHEKADQSPAFIAFLKRPVLVWATILNLLIGLIYSQFGFSLPLWLEASFGDQGPIYFGWIMTVNALVVIVFTPLLTLSTKRIYPLIGMSLSSLFYLIGFGMYSINLPLALVFVATFIWTCGEIVAVINYQHYFASRTPLNMRGRFNSYSHIITGIGYSIAPFLAGNLIEAVGINNLWYWVAGVAAITAIGFIFLRIFEKIWDNRQGYAVNFAPNSEKKVSSSQ